MSTQIPPRGRSKTPELTGKRTKKFSAASKSVLSRNGSLGRLNKLTRMDSEESIALHGSGKMNRSASSEVLLSRTKWLSTNSLTKLGRPLSQNSIRSPKERNERTTELDFHDSSDDIEDLEPIPETTKVVSEEDLVDTKAIDEEVLVDKAINEEALANTKPFNDEDLSTNATNEEAMVNKAINEEAMVNKAINGEDLVNKTFSEEDPVTKAIGEEDLPTKVSREEDLATNAVKEKSLATNAIGENPLATKTNSGDALVGRSNSPEPVTVFESLKEHSRVGLDPATSDLELGSKVASGARHTLHEGLKTTTQVDRESVSHKTTPLQERLGLRHPHPTHSNATSTESLHRLYGGSMLLSQSTGVERKVLSTTKPAQVNQPTYDIPDQYTGYNLHQPRGGESALASFISANGPLSFQSKRPDYGPLIPSVSTLSIAQHTEPVATALRPKPNTTAPVALRAPEPFLGSNFSGFLKSGPSAPESRTQQRLWLQRENSFLDVSPSVAHTQMSRIFGNSVQARTESERLAREFMNVRRYCNPVIESLERLRAAGTYRGPEGPRPSGSFEEYAPQAHRGAAETHAAMQRLWMEACTEFMAPQPNPSSASLGPHPAIPSQLLNPEREAPRSTNNTRAANGTHGSVTRHGRPESSPETLAFDPGNIRLAAERIHLV